MNYNAWTLFVDFSLMAGLLLLGQFLRAKVKLFQKLLLPASLIAGFIGLVLGPNGYKILPFSSSLGTYASILIVLIFAAMPIGDVINKEKLENVGGMFTNITGIAVLQYGLGMIIALYILDLFWDLPSGFGLILATGFYGGHGTAAAVGSSYAALGWAEATDLMMFSATVGIVGGILLGMVIINWATRKGYTTYVTNPKELPNELRTGMIPFEKQKLGNRITVSNISIDPLAFHTAIILVPSVLGYYLSGYIKGLVPWLNIPEFCLSLVFGFIVQAVLNRTNTNQYIDRATISRISGTCTDFLVIAGVASVKISVILNYMVPLIILFASGFAMTWIWFLIVGKYTSKKDWVERNMMVWGHATGVVATGVLLQRVVDPELKSRGIEDSGISDIINRPIIIGLQVIPPILLTMGGVWTHITTWGIMAILVVMMFIAWKLKWWTFGKNPQIEAMQKAGNIK